MGYRDALAIRQRGIEGRALQKGAAKKGLWGSIGRTLGGIAATALTGGAATPWAVGLMAGGGSLLGGAAGSAASGGKLKGGTFYKEEAESLQKELGAFGSRNITESLKGGVTAGIGQKLKLMKAAKAAKLADPTISKEALGAISKGKGFDFAESTVGRGLEKSKTKLFDTYTDIRTGRSTGFTGTGGGTGIKTSAQSISQIAPEYSEQLHAGTTFTDKLTVEGPLFGDPDAKPFNLWSKFKKDQDISAEPWKLSGLGKVAGFGGSE